MARKSRNLGQEAFRELSSRTYVSTMERGLKNPTLNKVDELSSVIGIHPLTLLALTYLNSGSTEEKTAILKKVSSELSGILITPVDQIRIGSESV